MKMNIQGRAEIMIHSRTKNSRIELYEPTLNTGDYQEQKG